MWLKGKASNFVEIKSPPKTPKKQKSRVKNKKKVRKELKKVALQVGASWGTRHMKFVKKISTYLIEWQYICHNTIWWESMAQCRKRHNYIYIYIYIKETPSSKLDSLSFIFTTYKNFVLMEWQSYQECTVVYNFNLCILYSIVILFYYHIKILTGFWHVAKIKVVNSVPYRPVRLEYTVPASNPVRSDRKSVV